MSHSSRVMNVKISATTNWKGQIKTFPTKTYSYPHTTDVGNAQSTAGNYTKAKDEYKSWLRGQGNLDDERQMSYLTWNMTHTVTYD
ncbi:MAG: hypothetical protein ACREFP_09870 [Acetobacteraceae bacterium]